MRDTGPPKAQPSFSSMRPGWRVLDSRPHKQPPHHSIPSNADGYILRSASTRIVCTQTILSRARSLIASGTTRAAASSANRPGRAS
jgi:hypothetical protein